MLLSVLLDKGGLVDGEEKGDVESAIRGNGGWGG